MFVTINDVQHVVEITSKPLLRDGKKLNAMIAYNERRVFISSQIPPCDRRKELIHELRHVWTASRGLPADDEGDARDVTEFLDPILNQIDAQGGNAKLMALQPVTQAYGPNEYRGFAPNSRHECKVCGAITMSGSVMQTPPKMHEHYGVHFVERQFECDACGTVNKWSEFCTEAGSPTGQPVPGVTYETV
jgi:hypothetical protein